MDRKHWLLIRMGILVGISVLLAGCNSRESGVFGTVLTLGFLPSGFEVITGNPLLANINLLTAPIPILGILINWLLALFINTMDFVLWFFSWIPGYKEIIGVVASSHDLDLGPWANFFSHHRNFLSHSVLNPVFVVYGIVAYGLSKIFRSPLRFILALPMMGFGLGLLADSMPQAWTGFSLIKVSLFGFYMFALPGLLSWIWLIANGFIALGISFRVAKSD